MNKVVLIDEDDLRKLVAAGEKLAEWVRVTSDAWDDDAAEVVDVWEEVHHPKTWREDFDNRPCRRVEVDIF